MCEKKKNDISIDHRFYSKEEKQRQCRHFSYIIGSDGAQVRLTSDHRRSSNKRNIEVSHLNSSSSINIHILLCIEAISFVDLNTIVGLFKQSLAVV